MKLLAIDGNSILNRAFYGIRMLTNSKGVPTNAVMGFMNIYLKAMEETGADAVAVAFDMHAPTFRHVAVESYKANRKGMPDELAVQLPLIKELLGFLGIAVVASEGFEADDILGTLAKACAENNNDCVVLTGDRDTLQLIDSHITVRLATTRETIIYNQERFEADYGFEPLSLIDLKALMGDSSDNIKGVAGVGEKTAKTLITQYKTIENLYKELEGAALSASVRAKLEAGREDAKQSKWLATIRLDAPVDKDIRAYIPAEVKYAEAAELLRELEMQKILERLSLNTVPAAVPPQSTLPDFDTAEGIAGADALETAYALWQDGILSVYQNGRLYIEPDRGAAAGFLKSAQKLVTWNAKGIYRLLLSAYGEPEFLAEFDAEICAYLLNAASADYSIERLCRDYSCAYNLEYPVLSLPSLYEKMQAELVLCGMQNLLYDIEQPLTRVLASMEHTGVLTDTAGVREFGEKLRAEMEDISAQIYSAAGHEFNILSPKQLGEVLFGELGLPSGRKTKTGYSTNAEVLEKLIDKHPIVPLVLKYRQLSKLASTYVDGLLKTVSEDGRIHTVFCQTETRTGRISSSEPNMQNIPIRTELGRSMRKFFTAPEGRLLLDADYSQIELRILAHMCGDKNMQMAFQSGEDIHTMTAAQVFNMPPMLITSEMRTAAKAVNFGIIYGIGAFSLSKDINVTVAQADRYIKSYLERYPGVRRFMDETVENAVRDGYVTTMLGRRRYIPELAASNKNIQAFGKRAAMNAPIQGTAADIIKIAMVRVYERLCAEKLDARLVLQVHDELIVEAGSECAERAAAILGEEMRGAYSLSVPLAADVNAGRTWADSH